MRHAELSSPDFLIRARVLGLSISQIARLLGCAESTVVRAMKREGVQ